MGIVGTISALVVAVMITASPFVIAYFNNQTQLMKRVGELTTQILGLQNQIIDCEKRGGDSARREADLKAEVQSQLTRIRALETATGTTPITALPGILIMDLKGVIREFSPTLCPIFHYIPKEIIGKPFSALLSAEAVTQYEGEFRKALDDPTSVDPVNEILTYGRTKEGDLVAISISLHGWSLDAVGGRGFLTATIRQRPKGSVV